MVGGEFLNVLWKLWYQGTIQMKYYEKKIRNTKDKLKCLQAYPIEKSKNVFKKMKNKMQRHQRLNLKAHSYVWDDFWHLEAI